MYEIFISYIDVTKVREHSKIKKINMINHNNIIISHQNNNITNNIMIPSNNFENDNNFIQNNLISNNNKKTTLLKKNKNSVFSRNLNENININNNYDKNFHSFTLTTLTRPVKRIRKSNEEKIEIIEFVEAGHTHLQASNKYNLSRTAVTKIIKEKSLIIEQCETNTSKKKRKVLKYYNPLEVIDKMLFEWIQKVEIHAPSLSISGKILQCKALDFVKLYVSKKGSELSEADKHLFENFKASNGWLEHFISRNNVSSLLKCGESGSVDPIAIEKSMISIRSILKDIPLGNIWNIDESALLFRTTSLRTYASINFDGRGVKQNPERVTITFIVNALGEKLNVQVIGKYKNPRCLKNIDPLKCFGIDYEAQSNGWQNRDTFIRLLIQINKFTIEQKQIFYILLDNCSSHIAAAKYLDPQGIHKDRYSYQNIVLVFLPPNTTCLTQPLDQGIIRSFKSSFRYHQLKDLIQAFDASPNSKIDLRSHTTLKHAMNWISKAWNNVSENTIRRCFVKSSCLPILSNAEANQYIDRVEYENDYDFKNLSDILKHLTLKPNIMEELGVCGSDPNMASQIISMDDSLITDNVEINDIEILESI